MNIRAAHPGKGMTPATRANIARIESLWAEARRRFGAAGPFLFGAFCAADAMYAPVVMRFATYGVALGPEAAAYCEAMRAARGVDAWIREALAETEIVAEDEPYAK
jgi:glutathione S-transferase